MDSLLFQKLYHAKSLRLLLFAQKSGSETPRVSFQSLLVFFSPQLQMQVTDSAQNGTTKKLRERLMQEDADLTLEERTKIRAKLEEIANSGQW
jgi:hypothetical protein